MAQRSINNEWRSRLANSINNLLVAYGATMDNSDHGKNLMHKLLLEGRLIIRGLPVNRYDPIKRSWRQH